MSKVVVNLTPKGVKSVVDQFHELGYDNLSPEKAWYWLLSVYLGRDTVESVQLISDEPVQGEATDPVLAAQDSPALRDPAVWGTDMLGVLFAGTNGSQTQAGWGEVSPSGEIL